MPRSLRCCFSKFAIAATLLATFGLAACQTGPVAPAAPVIHPLPDRPAGYAQRQGPKVAVILMHGKWGEPNGHITPLTSELRSRGLWVVTPTMSYSGSRGYDTSHEASIQEIHSIAQRLRAGGADRIFVGGHSMGAMTALAYALHHPDMVSGVLVIAPGHTPEASGFSERLGESTTRASIMIRKGEGNHRAGFLDLNSGNRTRTIYTTAAIYDSWFSIVGPANGIDNQRRMKKAIPQLWVIPDNDPAYPARNVKLYVEAAPPHPLTRIVMVPGEHLDGPARSQKPAVEFIQAVAGVSL